MTAEKVAKPRLSKDARRFAQLRKMFVGAPASEKFAKALNATCESACKHGRSPCWTQCGVRWLMGKWEAIPREEREAWLKKETGR